MTQPLTTVPDDEELLPSEKWWSERYDLLLSHGYRLRPRYRPGWVPPWIGTGKYKRCYEEGIFSLVDYVMDATRVSDGRVVSIKRTRANSREIAIALYLASDSGSPINHCMPVLDHFSDPALPDFSFLVMPLLRWYDDPPFIFVDEVMDFIQQTLEGLVYMHKKGVAHRDCSKLNIMMDGTALFPKGFHPVAKSMDPSGLKIAPERRRRDVRGVKYYFIDFGISSRFDENVSPEDRLVVGEDCQDREVPELSLLRPYDPFAVDIFILGNVYRRFFYDVYVNLSFLSDLVESMTAQSSADRPSAEEALSLFRDIISKQNNMKLRWVLKERAAGRAFRTLQDIDSAIRIGAYISREVLLAPLKVLRKWSNRIRHTRN